MNKAGFERAQPRGEQRHVRLMTKTKPRVISFTATGELVRAGMLRSDLYRLAALAGGFCVAGPVLHCTVVSPLIMSPPFAARGNPIPTPGLDAFVSHATANSDWLAGEMQRLEPAVRGYLRSHYPSIDADDVVQESYLKILRARATTGIISVKAYFFSVARNTARTLFRRRQIYSPIAVNELPEQWVVDAGRDAAETTNVHLRHALVVQAIDQLPDRCRMVISLAALEGCSSAEIAVRLRISEVTVRVQLARGVKKCAEFMRAKGERE